MKGPTPGRLRDYLSLAVDGSGVGRSGKRTCRLCHKHGRCRGHKLVAISVVGAGLDLPFDAEFCGPGTNELTAALGLLERAVARLGRRFADYLVVDGLYSGAPFPYLADKLGVPVIAALKDNLPELIQVAGRRFRPTAPHGRFVYNGGWVEFWDSPTPSCRARDSTGSECGCCAIGTYAGTASGVPTRLPPPSPHPPRPFAKMA